MPPFKALADPIPDILGLSFSDRVLSVRSGNHTEGPETLSGRRMAGLAGLCLFSGLVEAGGGRKVSLSTSFRKDGECPFSASSREVLSAAGSTEALFLWLLVDSRYHTRP